MKRLVTVVLLILFSVVLKGDVGFPLDPSLKAVEHASKGMMYSRWGNYFAAIEEFKIAIALNPRSSVSSSFYNNLGIVYLRVGKYKWAQECFSSAITYNPHCMYYYENLVDSYAKAGKLDEKEKLLLKNVDVDFENSYNWLMLGLIQEKKQNLKGAMKSYDNYILLEPAMVLKLAVENKLVALKTKQASANKSILHL